jgi:hypothetical protein
MHIYIDDFYFYIAHIDEIEMMGCSKQFIMWWFESWMIDVWRKSKRSNTTTEILPQKRLHQGI